MKNILLSISTLLSFFAASCSQSEGGTTNSDTVVKTAPTAPAATKTDKHLKIPGSHLYIIPPPGFAENKLSGQISKEYCSFSVMNIISGTTPKQFLAELKSQADKDFPGSWKEEDVMANGHAATIYQYKAAGIRQYYLYFTDGITTEMAIANLEETTDVATSQAMYETLKTVVVEN